MLLIFFQRIVIVLSNHISQCEDEGTEVNTTWLYRTLGATPQPTDLRRRSCANVPESLGAAGHFKEISRLYRPQISSFMSTL